MTFTSLLKQIHLTMRHTCNVGTTGAALHVSQLHTLPSIPNPV